MGSIASAIFSYHTAKEAAHEQSKAMREAQAKQEAADKAAQREADAKRAKEIRQRDYSSEQSGQKMRGIQATMLASKKAMNASAGSKTLLGE